MLCTRAYPISQVGHALVSTAVARLLPGSASVQKLSIIPRTGGALGFTYIPPNTEDRALMFDSEIRGQLSMLMGGRAAEQLTCASVSTGGSNSCQLIGHGWVVGWVALHHMHFCG
jgi:cell division protease FtsH